MKLKQISLDRARGILGEIVDKARLADQPTLITRQGKPAAVVVSVKWYEECVALVAGNDSREKPE